ncbi:MAG: HDOD domain-containing protein [Candidatus Gastranaerophilales bacterium]|nr:HDOD domain-containing protein [Candidatus Gastranaerophilales bacterium]
MLNKIVGYISSNKKNPVERDVELKVQREKILDFCRKRGLMLLEFYEEPANSTEDYKAELFRLLHDAAAKKFQHVIVLSLDRIAFDKVAKVWVNDELKSHGVKLHSLTENMVLSPDADEKTLSKAEKLKKKVRDLPSLPEIVNKVIELVQNPNSSAAQLAKVISNDAGLTSRVLRLVNSAYYGFPKQIASIQHAIAILGFTTIRGLVLSSSIFKMFAPKDNAVKMLDYKKLWSHSLTCAIIAKKISKMLKIPDDDNMFSASILHDMGKIILDQYDHGNYIIALSDFVDLDLIQNLEAEKKYCGLNHCEAGDLIAQHWNLPDAISEVIRNHHAPQEALEEYQKMTCIIALANVFAVLHEKDDMELNLMYIKNIDLDILNINNSNIFDIYYYCTEELKEEGSIDHFFD